MDGESAAPGREGAGPLGGWIAWMSMKKTLYCSNKYTKDIKQDLCWALNETRPE